MGFWNKLGKIALQAAPYVAAPFTGGASLMATGLTNQLGQKWAEHDATEAAKKGLAPSKFDKYLGLASGAAGLASSFAPVGGALTGLSKAGKAVNAANKAANTGKKVSGFASALNKVNTGMNTAQGINSLVNQARNINSDSGQSYNQSNQQSYNESSPSVPSSDSRQAQVRPEMSGFAQQLYDQFGPVMGAANQNNPNLAFALGQGRMEALQNQPFRSGYQVNAVDKDDKPYTYQQGPIYPQYKNQPGSRN
jgi:hypothetical protein